MRQNTETLNFDPANSTKNNIGLHIDPTLIILFQACELFIYWSRCGGLYLSLTTPRPFPFSLPNLIVLLIIFLQDLLVFFGPFRDDIPLVLPVMCTAWHLVYVRSNILFINVVFLFAPLLGYVNNQLQLECG